jgi:hypothetical protein
MGPGSFGSIMHRASCRAKYLIGAVAGHLQPGGRLTPNAARLPPGGEFLADST